MADADPVHLIISSLAADGAAAGPGIGPQGCLRLVFPFARLSLLSLGGQVTVRQPEGAGVECTVSLPRATPADAAGQPDHHAQVSAGLLTRLNHAALLGPSSRAEGFSR